MKRSKVHGRKFYIVCFVFFYDFVIALQAYACMAMLANGSHISDQGGGGIFVNGFNADVMLRF